MSDFFVLLYKECRRNLYHTPGIIAGWLLASILLCMANIYPLAGSAQACIWLLTIGGLFLGWQWIRRIPRFAGSKKIGILFAPYGDEDVQDDIKNLKAELTERLKGTDYANLFVIKDLPENRIVRDVESALATRQKSGCLLLIWGRYEKGNLQAKELRGFLPGKLNFTYSFKGDAQGVHEDMNKGITNRAFMFSSENDLVEREFVMNNLFDVARYIIGTCLITFGELGIGRGLLQEILIKPKGAWIGRSQTVIRTFLENIKKKIARIDFAHALHVYNRQIFPAGKLERNAEALKMMVSLLQQSLANYPETASFLLLAIARFLSGDIKGAKQLVSRQIVKQTVDPSPMYSLAFLFAYEGNLMQAEKHYRRAFKRTSNANPEWAFHLVEFTAAVLELEPKRICLHYALGLLHQEMIDPALAKTHFQKFIDLAKDPAYAPWAAKAHANITALEATQPLAISPN